MKVLKLLRGFESWWLLKFGRVLKLIFGWGSRSRGDSISWGSVKVLEGLKLILGVFEVLGGSKVLGVQGFEGC